MECLLEAFDFDGIFLVKEYGVTVFANDLWIDPTEYLKRIVSARVEDKVFPIKAEAHFLPYAHGYFDAIISFDSYHYYGTDEYYIFTITDFLRPGGMRGDKISAMATRPAWDFIEVGGASYFPR